MTKEDLLQDWLPRLMSAIKDVRNKEFGSAEETMYELYVEMNQQTLSEKMSTFSEITLEDQMSAMAIELMAAQKRVADLENSICQRSFEAKQEQGEPVTIYQYQKGDGSWIDQEKHSYDYNKLHAPNATLRVLYTTPLAKQEQGEPVAFITNRRQRMNVEIKPDAFVWMPTTTDWEIPLYTTPQQRKALWIDPNDKTQEQFLPNIGEPILFCHDGKTYYGQHNGGSFQYGYGVTKRYYNTWECRWMYFPAAHGIKVEA